ncbi:MAG: trypsin-like peptidase domain-containing protein [Patescibacteria group bacterium]
MAQDYENAIIKTVKSILPAVVSISVAKEEKVLEEEIFSRIFRAPGYAPIYPEDIESEIKKAPHDEKGRVQLGGGSGFLASSDGLVLTNKHVVMDPNASYSVMASDGKIYEAAVLARDPINDIAILKIPAKNLPVVKLGSSENVELGQTVVAIGNALGQFQNSVSTGIISGLSRLITATTDFSGHQERLRGLIQTDAAINPGNSGGPLVALDAKAVGINSAIVFGAQNIGFAIPIERAKQALEEIKKYGRIRKPFLGVRYLILNPGLKTKFHLPLEKGALIVNEGVPGDEAVIAGSPAEKAGLKEFDVIISCNQKSVTEKETLEDILSESKVGDKISLRVLRQGKEFDAELTLQEFKSV